MASILISCPKTLISPSIHLQATTKHGSIMNRIHLPRSDPKPGTRLVAMANKPIAASEFGKMDEELLVEELESLEEEAIAGKDEGREPTDYDRRASIFHESSRVFQALKERSSVDVDDGDGGDEKDGDRLQCGTVD